MSLSEYELYQQDPHIYTRRGLCEDLEDRYSKIFERLDNGRAFINSEGQIIQDNRVLAGLYTAEVEWTDDAKQLVPSIKDTNPFRAVALIKNPGMMNNPAGESDAYVGAINALVMVDGTLWCAQVKRNTAPLQLVRRVTDLVFPTPSDILQQQYFSRRFLQLVHQQAFPIQAWKPVQIQSN